MNQKEHWETLRSSIQKSIDSLTVENVQVVSKELLLVNILRGQGLFCRYLIEKALPNPKRCPEYASLVSVINSQFPEIGELLGVRLAVLFKKFYVDNEYLKVTSSIAFICELTLQNVLSEVLTLQILQVLLDKQPSPDSVRVLEQILLRVGGRLLETSNAAANVVFDRLRMLLQLGKFKGATLRRIGELLRSRRDGLTLKLDPRLDVVPEEDKACCLVDITGELDPQTHLNYFREDPEFEDTERQYEEMKSEFWPEEESAVEVIQEQPQVEEKVTDMTDAQLIQNQKSIYLTIMSSMSADEAVHKLMKLQRREKLDDEVLIDMIVKCCAQDKTYSKYFGVIGDKICRMGPKWQRTVSKQFCEKYDTIFQFEGPQLRNIGKFFGHLLASDVLSLPDTLGHISLTESETTSAGRVFIKFIFQEMIEELGVGEVQKVLDDPAVRSHLRGLLPVTNVTTADQDHIMFSINYFTAIGLGVLTEEMREVLKNLPEEPRGRKRSRRGSGSLALGSYSRSSSYSRSRSGSYSRSRSGSFSRSPSNSGSFSRSPSRDGSTG
ncbi:hypothetical protein PUMCH_001438 [Australozyma saopauloensis]|uniref:Pre-mRNA-splicing factor CWC22 n=1 Tax=Australozyma saopauloensis TaxID=291208 RepID=A0AAX4H6H6_9ASCO|nr:hypothetical protein PUMCH_001438 [[Candida] saopauloensis]